MSGRPIRIQPLTSEVFSAFTICGEIKTGVIEELSLDEIDVLNWARKRQST